MKKKKGFIIAIAVIAGLSVIAGVYFILSSLGILYFGFQKNSAVYYKAKSMSKTAIATITPPSFSAKETGHYGDHIYWPEDFWGSDYLNEAQKNDIFSYFPDIDRKLSGDVYITSISSGDGSPYLDYDYSIRFCQFIDGVIINNTRMAATIQNGQVSISMDYSYPFLDSIPDLDSSALVPMDEVIQTVEKHAKDHENEMFMGQKEPIKGTYTLHYGTLYGAYTPTYYYDFVINEYSNVEVDPFTGNVLHENYWNGVYVD